MSSGVSSDEKEGIITIEGQKGRNKFIKSDKNKWHNNYDEGAFPL